MFLTGRSDPFNTAQAQHSPKSSFRDVVPKLMGIVKNAEVACQGDLRIFSFYTGKGQRRGNSVLMFRKRVHGRGLSFESLQAKPRKAFRKG